MAILKSIYSGHFVKNGCWTNKMGVMPAFAKDICSFSGSVIHFGVQMMVLIRFGHT